ncbi:MAG: phosphoribosylaminoimidazolesuccinocarboxamide synthase [Bacteroidota bacterium]|nr:phosphoribosylaminoimidazolesuccinocarboxamide synthase [Bacteroidota bacterium]
MLNPLNLPEVESFYQGKIRDVYTLSDGRLVMISSDRISAFDHILPVLIPAKGAILNTLAAKFLQNTESIVPNWLRSIPDARAAIGIACQPIKIEMVVRGYLCGHALRQYQAGHRSLCGVILKGGMSPYQKLDTPIITPTTKADKGHDEDIDRDSIIARAIVSKEVYEQLEDYTYKLFEAGTNYAENRGLILADSKYEFGIHEGTIQLIDEVHTPDSSRYYYTEGYQQHVNNHTTPRQLSKEFVREWLMENGFQGKEGQQIPEINNQVIEMIRARYLELFEVISGEKFDNNNLATTEEELCNKIIASL